MMFKNNLFGVLPDGREARLFTIATPKGLEVSITNFGGIITSIKAPDRQGVSEEITAGFPTLEGYLNDHPYFGVIAGRFANRIAKGRFDIDGKTFSLPVNNGPNHLHGGNKGFHTRLWDYVISENPGSVNIRLRYLSPHHEEGYPGNLKAQVTYCVKEDNALEIHFEAETDATTHVNLTNHAYFNLGGFQKGVFDHQLMLDANHYLELDETQIPTGKMLPCENTFYDYRPIPEKEKSLRQLREPMDLCFVLNHGHSLKEPAAILFHPSSGRKLSLFCTQPGIQVYTANFLDGSMRGHQGIVYQKHHAICLETQHFPDSPNQAGFPSTLLKPGEKYKHTSRFAFEAK
jgi:aldose 1-epimerase